MKIAVTGATGLVGNNLCRALIERGHDVRALVYKRTAPIAGLDLRSVTGDILEPASLLELCNGVDVVFHVAARISIDGDPDGNVMRVNVEGTRNVIDACLACQVKRLIYFSTIHVFQQEPLDEEMDERWPYIDENIASLYDRSKFLAEMEVKRGLDLGLDAVILNPTSMFGPQDFRPSLMGKALIDLYNQKFPSLIPGGFDWIDVRDVVEASIKAMEKGRKGERYILSGKWMTTREVAEIAHVITGKKIPRFTSPSWLAKIGIPFIKFFSKVAHSHPLFTEESLKVALRCNRNIRSLKAERELGYAPRSLKETIKDTYFWFKETEVIN